MIFGFIMLCSVAELNRQEKNIKNMYKNIQVTLEKLKMLKEGLTSMKR